jgi:hypothetical protein
MPMPGAPNGRSNERGDEGAGVADITQGLTALDRGKDPLQQRAGITTGTDISPQPSEVHRGAQFE